MNAAVEFPIDATMLPQHSRCAAIEVCLYFWDNRFCRLKQCANNCACVNSFLDKLFHLCIDVGTYLYLTKLLDASSSCFWINLSATKSHGATFSLTKGAII